MMPLGPSNQVLAVGGDRPFATADDVRAILPPFLRQSDAAPVREALLAALTAMVATHPELAAYAAAQSSLLYATEDALDELAGEHGVYRQDGELDEPYRARALAVPTLVSRLAILTAVNTLLSPFSSVPCRAFDSIRDRCYVFNGATSATPRTYIGASPFYPERFYPDEAAGNAGLVRAQSAPPGAWVYADGSGRFFSVIVPDVSPQEALITPVWDNGHASGGFFIGDGSASNTTFVFRSTTTAQALYSAIVAVVDRIKMQGVRWQLFVQPDLV